MQLIKGSTMQLRGAEGIEVRCDAGHLWLTEAGDPVDYFLERGLTHRVRTHGVVVIEALSDATLEVELLSTRHATWTRATPRTIPEAT